MSSKIHQNVMNILAIRNSKIVFSHGEFSFFKVSNTFKQLTKYMPKCSQSVTRIVEKRDPQGFQIAVEKHVLKKSRNLPENDPNMRSQKVIVLLFFKGLGPRVPQGGPGDDLPGG